jgi:hypothetical protein
LRDYQNPDSVEHDQGVKDTLTVIGEMASQGADKREQRQALAVAAPRERSTPLRDRPNSASDVASGSTETTMCRWPTADVSSLFDGAISRLRRPTENDPDEE